MMYQDKFVTAVKVAGKILREDNDAVLLPFGAEYSLLLKNKNSVRALVSVEIDGTDVTGNSRLIVPANGSIDLERFLKDGNMDEGLRFKFIERSKKIEDGPRGIKAEDGLIRIEFEFERIPAPVNNWFATRQVLTNTQFGHDPFQTYGHITCGNLMGSTSIADVSPSASSGVLRGATMQAMNCSAAYDPASITKDFYFGSTDGSSKVETLNDVGITVGGSVSEQRFTQGAWFPTDGVKHVMIMKLLGQIGEVPVLKAVTVKTKLDCPTCGTKNKHGTKFCKECGTGLIIV